MASKKKAVKQPAKKAVRKAARKSPRVHDVMLDKVPDDVAAEALKTEAEVWNEGWEAGYKEGRHDVIESELRDATLRQDAAAFLRNGVAQWLSYGDAVTPGNYLILPQDGTAYTARLILTDYGNGKKTLHFAPEGADEASIPAHAVKRVYGPIPEEG